MHCLGIRKKKKKEREKKRAEESAREDYASKSCEGTRAGELHNEVLTYRRKDHDAPKERIEDFERKTTQK